MSLTTWKKEFYPETAKKAAKRGVEAAIEHSLRKWRGATDENVKKHDVGVDGYSASIRGSRSMFTFDYSTCALCSLFYDDDCTGCPLVGKDGRRCYSRGRGYHTFADIDQGPNLMIQELEAALEKWRERKCQ